MACAFKKDVVLLYVIIEIYEVESVGAYSIRPDKNRHSDNTDVTDEHR